MVTIGNDTLPGTITTIESAPTTGANIGAPAVPVLIGQADLDNGTASADTAKKVTRPKQAADFFGEAANSQLTVAIQDALGEGAYPVHAIAPPETDVTGEDLSGNTTQTGTLANAPAVEITSDITFTVNSTTKTTVLYYKGDPSNATPGTDEVYLNPQTGNFKVDETMGTAGDAVDYSYVDFSNTFDEITNATLSGGRYLREVADFLALVDEKDSVVSSLQSKADSMESNGWFNIAIGGAGKPWLDDVNTSTDEISSYSDSFDTSRLQLIHPSRDSDGDTIMGAYVGRRSALGIDASPLYKHIGAVDSLIQTLSRSQREDLVNANVNPIIESGSAVKIEEDLTTVSDSNSTESAWQRGFARLVTDYTTEAVQTRAEPFIGSFNQQSVRNTISGHVSSELTSLLSSDSISAYSLVVESVDDTTVAVDVGINTSDVLRNVEITISAGSVTNAVSTE